MGTMCNVKICPMLAIKISIQRQWRHSSVCIANFEHFFKNFFFSLSFERKMWNMFKVNNKNTFFSFSIVDFEQVNTNWVFV